MDGKLPVTKKYRGSIEKVVEEYVRDRLRDRTDLDTRRAFLVDTCPDDHLASIAREVLRQDGRFQEIIEAKAGCTIFCHCGPGTLGVISCGRRETVRAAGAGPAAASRALASNRRAGPSGDRLSLLEIRFT